MEDDVCQTNFIPPTVVIIHSVVVVWLHLVSFFEYQKIEMIYVDLSRIFPRWMLARSPMVKNGYIGYTKTM